MITIIGPRDTKVTGTVNTTSPSKRRLVQGTLSVRTRPYSPVRIAHRPHLRKCLAIRQTLPGTRRRERPTYQPILDVGAERMEVNHRFSLPARQRAKTTLFALEWTPSGLHSSPTANLYSALPERRQTDECLQNIRTSLPCAGTPHPL